MTRSGDDDDDDKERRGEEGREGKGNRKGFGWKYGRTIGGNEP